VQNKVKRSEPAVDNKWPRLADVKLQQLLLWESNELADEEES
jgi:hypothetical protein